MKISKKIRFIILLMYMVVLFFDLIFAKSKNSLTQMEESKEFYSKFVVSENINDGVKIAIVKSDKYGDFQDEYVAVDVKVENLNRYADLLFNIEVIDHNEFKIINKNKNFSISAGGYEDMTFDYKFNKPTILYDEKIKKLNLNKHILFAKDTDTNENSYIDGKYRRDIEKTINEFDEIEKQEKQKTRKTIMIVAIIIIAIFIILTILFFIRKYIKTYDDLSNLIFIIGFSIIILMSSIFSKKNVYADNQQRFLLDTAYSHIYICEVWHGGVAKTFRYRVNYKFVGNVPTYPENQDSDNDLLLDNDEVYYMTDINNVDTDFDGISDYDEIFVIDTNPLIKDTNNNGIDDGDEDFDCDYLTNIEERDLETFMNDIDTDLDGLSDYDEVKKFFTNPLKVDTDLDGLSDYEEVEIAKILGINDISSIDTNIKFEQKLNRDNIDKEINLNNVISVSIYGNLPGLIDKHIELKNAKDVEFIDIDSMISKPMYLKSDYENEKVTISFDCSNFKERLMGLRVATIVNGEIKLMETKIDDNKISAEVDSGYIFVIDGIRYIDNILTYKKDNYK